MPSEQKGFKHIVRLFDPLKLTYNNNNIRYDTIPYHNITVHCIHTSDYITLHYINIHISTAHTLHTLINTDSRTSRSFVSCHAHVSDWAQCRPVWWALRPFINYYTRSNRVKLPVKFFEQLAFSKLEPPFSNPATAPNLKNKQPLKPQMHVSKLTLQEGDVDLNVAGWLQNLPWHP